MTRRTLLSFGASGFAQNVIGTCLGVHLFVFYTDVIGLAPLWISAGLIVAMAWDAVSDLAMGRISDRTRFAAGRGAEGRSEFGVMGESAAGGCRVDARG